MNKSTLVILCFSLSISLLKSQSGQSASHKQISFKENKGQISDQNYNPRPDILFSGTDGQLNFYFKASGLSYQLNRIDSWMIEKPMYLSPDKRRDRKVPSQRTVYRVDINWLNTNTSPEISKGTTLQGFDNYYGETCPQGALNVKSYESILYKNLYAGIDLKWYTKEKSFEYDYYVAAFADYKKIKWEYKGAEKIFISNKGELIIQTPLGNIVEQKPVVIQDHKTLEAQWVVENTTISFDIKNVNHALPMTIDPMVRIWGTYFGGSGDDFGYSVKTDNAANVYLSGETQSTSNIATTGAHQTTYGGMGQNFGDAFVTKYNLAGVLQWSTYYGGAQDDFCNFCAIDGNGNVFMVGGTSTTNSAVIATPGAHQSTAPTTSSVNPGSNDAFLVKFNSSGVRQWGTYYGGLSYEWAYYVDVNSAGDIIMSGASNSTDGTSIATANCHQSTYGGGSADGFLVKFNAAGVRQWGTYYGGSGTYQDDLIGCIFDASGDIYICGGTPSTNGIATSNGHQPTYGGGIDDGFFAKFNSAGVRQWGTYYGGAGVEILTQPVIDASGDIYLSGNTSASSTAIATPGCHQPLFGGGFSGNGDGIFVKFNSSGVRQWGTYYGGNGDDTGGGASIDPSGNIYFMGYTSTHTGTAIATACAYQPVYAGGSSDVYLAKFTPSGTRIWGTYFGSIYSDLANWCATDIHGNVYLSGTTLANSGTVMVTAAASQTAYGGMTDTFLEKFDGCLAGSITNLTPPSNLLICPGDSTVLSATCGNWYSSPISTIILATGESFTTAAISSDTTFYIEDFGCGSVTGTRTAVSLTVTSLPTLTVTNSNPVACVTESVVLNVSGASTYSWINTSETTSAIHFNVLLPTTYSVIGTDANGCKTTATLAIVPNLCLGINEQVLVNAQVSVYPNPGKGQVTLHSVKDLDLILINELGQTLQNIDLNAEHNFEFILRDLPNGIYFLKNKKDNTTLNKKIVIMR